MIPVGLFYLMGIVIYNQGVKSDKRKLAILIIIFSVFWLSFAYQPLASDDLTREYAALENIRKYGWKFFSMDSSNYYSGTLGTLTSSKFEGIYVTQVIYYIFAQLPIYNFLPAVVVAAQFLLEFKLLEKIKRKFELTQVELMFLFLLFFLTRELRWMMTGIRNQLAFTIAVYVLYNDVVEHKNRILSIIGLVICGMIHQSAYVFLVIRLILLIPNIKIKYMIAFCSMLWSNMLELLLGFVQKFYGLPIFNSLLWKLAIYTQNDSGNNMNVILRPYYFKMIISDIGLILFAIMSCYLFNKLYNNKSKQNRKIRLNLRKAVLLINHERSEQEWHFLSSDYMMFILLITCITIGSNIYYWFFLRLAIVLQIGLFVLSGAIVYKYRITDQYDKRNQYIVLGLASVLLKFLIMMFVANTSFDFNLLGLYPR